MNTRERFVRVLTGRDADRVPFIKLFGGTNAVVQRWLTPYPLLETYIDELLGFEGGYRGWRVTPVNMGLCGLPDEKTEKISETETKITRGDGTVVLRIEDDGHFFNQTVEHPVKTADDWLKIKKLWLDPDDPARFPAGWRHFTDMYLARDYPLQLTCGGVYGFARRLMGDEALCLSMYDDPELVTDIIETYINMCVKIWKRMVSETGEPFDIIECWEDMAYKNGSIISRAHFDKFLAPQYRRISDFAGEAGIPVLLVDSDGNTMELAKWMYDCGVNAMYPFEVRAGNDIPRLRSSIPGVGALGGLDKECMAGGKADIDAELDKARELIPLGRFIPGPDHFVLENVPFENYIYFMRGLRRVVTETKF